MVVESGVERLLQLEHRETVLFTDLRMMPQEFLYGAGFLRESQPTCHWDVQRWSGREFAMVLFTMSGRGWLQHGGRRLSVEPGQVVLLDFPNDHQHWIDDGESWEYFYITVSGNSAVKTMREIVAKVGPVVVLDDESLARTNALRACTDVLDNRIQSPYRASELGRELTALLRAEILGRVESTQSVGRPAPAFVAEVEQFCRRNLARPIGVEDMARVARMSRYHFSRQFGRARGISPGRYLATLRLDEARRLLTGGAHSVKEVAEQCGYGDANYFCKVFRRSFGVSPGTVRYAHM
jgi:AraC-like DNA-binding protein